MSAMDDLKERLSSDLKSVLERVQESSLFIQIREKYENLTPPKQKLSIIVISLTLVYLVFSIPFSYYSVSNEHVAAFEDKRQLIRDMLKVARDSKDLPNIAIPPDLATLRSQIQGLLESDRLVPTQIVSVENAVTTSKLIPNNLSQGSVNVNLSQLNLRQVVEIGHQLQSINQSIKMTDLDIRANSKDSRYFDVIYKLVVLAIPQQTENFDVEVPKGAGKGTSKDDN